MIFSLLLAAQAWAAPSPSSHFDFERPAAEIAAHCAKAKKRAETRLVEVASLSAVSRTFANTPAAIEDAFWTLLDETSWDQFAKYVHVSSAARAAGADCETLVRQFPVELYGREDVYKGLKAYAAKKEKLAGEDARVLRQQLLKFKRAGMELDAEKRAQLLAMRKELVALAGEYTSNLNSADAHLLLTRDALAGMPDDYVARLPKDGDRYKVTTDYPDYVPFMKNAKDPEARRRLETLFNSAAAEKNTPLLKKILALRAQAAKLQGYPDHAAYAIEERMAKNPETVARFLDRLVTKLKPLGKKELGELVKLKDAELGAKSDHVIHYYDWQYYDNQRLKAAAVDKEAIKEYFPLETVLSGMFEIYQKLLGVKYRQLDGPTWHPDVKLYEMTDAGTNQVLGYFYLDLFPREGKYKHAAAFDLIDSRHLADDTAVRPVAAMVANFPKPSPGRPSLLRHGTHEDVETLFHEFGHIMHQTLTKTKYGRFSGASTLGDSAYDFAEAPSQMLENWTWDQNVMEMISGRYDDPSKKFPKELGDKLRASRQVDIGIQTLRQLTFARADLQLHMREGADPARLWSEVQNDVLMIPVTPGTHPEARFGHIMDGYDAGYYGYLWSEVFAADMFSEFEKRGLLDPILGRRYREQILEIGSARDEADSLKAFMGRAPDETAFLKSLGLQH